MNSIEHFFQTIPKPELHVHVRGAMPIQVFTQLLNRYSLKQIWQDWPATARDLFTQYDNIRPFMTSCAWTEPDVAALFQFRSFPQFLTTFCFTGYFIQTAEDLDLLFTGVMAAFKAQNITYAELTISLREYLRPALDLQTILQCMAKTANQDTVRIAWIVDLVRDFGAEAAYDLLHDILFLDHSMIKGITLGGSEHLFPPKSFIRSCRLAKDAGLRLSIHAGEGAGPESVWSALEDLGADRIGHGVRSIEDARLVTYLADNKIPLELCPTSNIRTGIFPSYHDLPIRAFLDAGIILTLNTDDPTFFQTNLAHEYALAASLGITKTELITILKNGYRAAFLSGTEKTAFLHQVRAHLERAGIVDL